MLNKAFIKEDRSKNLRKRYPLSSDTTFKGGANISVLHCDEIQEECIITFPKWLEGNVVDVDTDRGKRKAIIVSAQYQEGGEPFERLWFPATFRRSCCPYVNGRILSPEFTKGEVADWFKQRIKDNKSFDQTVHLLLGRKIQFSDARIGQCHYSSHISYPMEKEIRGYTLFTINWADGRGNPIVDYAQLFQQFKIIASEIQSELSDFEKVREEHAALWKEKREWESKFNQLKEIFGK